MLSLHFNSFFSMFLMSLLCLSLMRLVQADCETCILISYYKCNVCYNTCEGNKFQTCSRKICTDEQCHEVIDEFLPEDSCFKNCCGGYSQQDYFSVEQLDKCDAQGKKTIVILAAVLSSVIGGIPLLLLICFFCKCGGIPLIVMACGCLECFCSCLSYLNKCQCLRKKVAALPHQTVIEISQTIQIWKQDENAPKMFDGVKCGKCNRENPNTVFVCNHTQEKEKENLIHSRCIQNCFRFNTKNDFCRGCSKSQKIQQVRLYCIGCWKYIQKQMKYNKEYAKIQEVKCPDCKQKEKICKYCCC